MNKGVLLFRILVGYAVLVSTLTVVGVGWFVWKDMPVGHILTTHVDAHLHKTCRPVVVCEPRDPSEVADPQNPLMTVFTTLDEAREAAFHVQIALRPHALFGPPVALSLEEEGE